jgi:RHS repeat-associated protein
MTRIIYRAFFALLCCALIEISIFSQAFDGHTPSGLASGNPLGSYQVSGLDSINYYNGNLSFNLPLHQVGGRGEAGYTIALNVESHWSRRFQPDPEGDGPGEWFSEFNSWPARDYRYTPGILLLRGMVTSHEGCPSPIGTGQVFYTTKLTFIAGDGTETELIDTALNGRWSTSYCTWPADGGFNRGTTFTSRDGSAMTFVSDAPIRDTPFRTTYSGNEGLRGWLAFRNGLHYRIEDGFVTKIRDRNGNEITLHYTSDSPAFRHLIAITDSLNRRVTIEYGANDGSYGVVDRITVVRNPSSENRVIRIKNDYIVGGYPPCPPAGSCVQSRPTKVWLPDGRFYQLMYNTSVELSRVVLPTGGAIEYTWAPGLSNTSSKVVNNTPYVYSRVVERRWYLEGRAGDDWEQRLEISRPETDTGAGRTTAGFVDVKTWGAGNMLLSRSKHYFFGSPASSFFAPGEYFGDWRDGREWKTEHLSDNGEPGTVVSRTESDWATRIPVEVHPLLGHQISPPNEPRVVRTRTVLQDTNQVAMQEFGYDEYNNVTDVYEYDFGVDAPGPLIRRTHTSYLTANANQGNANYATDFNIHIRDLPAQKIVYDATGDVKSQTDFIYDYYGAFPLVDRSGIVQHDGGFHSGYGARGNLAGVIHRNPGGSPSEIQLHSQYDIAGNMVKAVDGRGTATDFDFSDCFGLPDDDARQNTPPAELNGQMTYAFATKVTNALGHEAYMQYDYYLGRTVNSQDANGVVSSITYNDVLDRPTQSIQARYKVGVGVPAERSQSTIIYDDVNRVVTATSDLNTFNDNALAGKSYYDGLGRARRSAAREGSTWIITDTRFDGLSRVSQVSNPYRADDPDSASPPSDQWTTTDYDALGRVIMVTTPDGAHADTAYSGNQVTVTDQAGKKRRSETDALGRLVKVTENPGGLNYETFYSYDVLGNLLMVTQGSQTRTFVYDSLSRMIRATNPESGIVTYAYDENGNLIEKTDAREVKATMTYDPLNRVVSKAYMGATAQGMAVANLTPSVRYFYDDYSALPIGAPTWPGTPSKGRLIGVTYGTGSEGTYYKYDAAGRIATSSQRQGTTNYTTAYFYNLANALTREERGNPVRRRNQLTYDEAGRLTVLGTSVHPFVGGTNLIGGISYTPFGALQSETYGNGLIHSVDYNKRQQPTEISLGRPDNLESVFRLNYIYGIAHNVNGQDSEITPTHNNGDIARIKYFIGGTLQYSQTFQYDPVNRLRYAVEHKNGTYNDSARAWYQAFDYDFCGNRGINVENTSDNTDATNTALKLADFSAANNRITREGYVYDAAGNLTTEPGKGYYTYDGENRIVTAIVAGGVTSQYVYDGNGRRVKKIVGSVATRFEYGAGGELIVERNDSNGAIIKEYFYKGGGLLATITPGGQLEYQTADHLGSPRVWTDQAGNVVAGGRHDYLPFGEELFVGYGTRTTDQGYAASAQQDGQQTQFTDKKRDVETGLDYFGARYFASAQGRFTSADPMMASGRVGSPQSWNRYSYVLNNPLRFIDPEGFAEEENEEEKRKKAYVIIFGGGSSTKKEFDIGPRTVSPGPNPAGLGEASLDDNESESIAQQIANDFPEAEVIQAGPGGSPVKEIAAGLIQNTPGHILIYGFSAGAKSAAKLTNLLNENGIKVDQVTTVDPEGFNFAGAAVAYITIQSPKDVAGLAVPNLPRINNPNMVGDALNIVGMNLGKVAGARNEVVGKPSNSDTPFIHRSMDDIASPRVIQRIESRLSQIFNRPQGK